MYNFSYFKENDSKTLCEFIDRYPLALLTGSFLSGQQVATQIPLLLVERNGVMFLQGHVMKNTDHYKAFLGNPEVLSVFTGPNAYISASWYSNPQIGSTWNYMSVYIKGEVRFMIEEELVQFMRRFTLKFEHGNINSPTIYDNLPNSFLNKMMPGIAGLELKVEDMDSVFKLSQNRDEKSYRNIISKLEAQDWQSQIIAKEMKKRLDGLFPPGTEWDPSRFDS